MSCKKRVDGEAGGRVQQGHCHSSAWQANISLFSAIQSPLLITAHLARDKHKGQCMSFAEV